MTEKSKTGWKNEVQKRVEERYFKEYVADEDESRELKEMGFSDSWFTWWIVVLLDELQTQRQELIEEFRNEIDNRVLTIKWLWNKERKNKLSMILKQLNLLRLELEKLEGEQK
jgi:hypothetical protein